MHKRIGILGGMSPESTDEYYRHFTHSYTDRFGDFSFPEIIIYSVTFQPYVDWPKEDRWDLVAEGLSQAAQSLEAAGADFIIIATNTMHLVFDKVQANVNIPMLSLLDAVGLFVGHQVHHGEDLLPPSAGPKGRICPRARAGPAHLRGQRYLQGIDGWPDQG